MHGEGQEEGEEIGVDGWEFRRNCLTPVPEAESLAVLNDRLRNACLRNRDRTIRGKQTTVGVASEQERKWLLPVAKEGFPVEEVIYPLVVDNHCRVKVKAN